jgi:hemoglobin
MQVPDLDSRENIGEFVDCFYRKILADSSLAPIFIDVAEVDLAVHLPHIKDYWCKLLLADKSYQRHTMNIHRNIHAKRALLPRDFQRWLDLFVATAEEGYAGERAERAKKIAKTIAENMQKALPLATVIG